jgi:hypothetical protein
MDSRLPARQNRTRSSRRYADRADAGLMSCPCRTRVPWRTPSRYQLFSPKTGPVAADADGIEVILAGLELEPQEVVLDVGMGAPECHVEAGIVALPVSYSLR